MWLHMVVTTEEKKSLFSPKVIFFVNGVTQVTRKNHINIDGENYHLKI